jgi:hypothetical protein
VIEARQLNGGSGSAINPVTQVKFMNQTETTSVEKTTTCPWFDDDFFFYPAMTPKELFAQNLIFEVSNAKKFRSDSVIGTFKASFHKQDYVGFDFDRLFEKICRWIWGQFMTSHCTHTFLVGCCSPTRMMTAVQRVI